MTVEVEAAVGDWVERFVDWWELLVMHSLQALVPNILAAMVLCFTKMRQLMMEAAQMLYLLCDVTESFQVGKLHAELFLCARVGGEIIISSVLMCGRLNRVGDNLHQ